MKTIALAALLLAPAAFAQAPTEDKPQAGAENANPPPDVTKMPFTPDSIKQVIAYHQPKVQECYEDLLAGKEKVVEGKLMTSFVITAEGLVKKPKVVKKGTTLREPKLHDCVVAVLAAMEFPRPPDGRDHPIEFPFNLKAIK